MRKQYILYIVIAILSLTNILNINNVSALSYESNVGVGFTFNPTLSVSLSSSDLIIPNLVPGNTLDSNSINVSVTTNAAYGYTLSATVGDNTHDNSNLTHSNNTNVFSSIATDADLPSLTTDNTWGYNTSLDGGSTWSNYNGLSNSSITTLLDKDSNISSNIDFRIRAKASPVQPSGTYTNTITFTAVTKPTPITLSEAYASEGKTMINGYYTMQDMTSTICNKVEAIGAQLQVLDKRDNKLYWISKLADNHCWMTQNLDLDLSHEVALTSETSDIDPESYDKTIYTTETGYSRDETTGIVSWLPSTIDDKGIQRVDTILMNWTSSTGAGIPNWVNDNNQPYSADAGDRYRYTNPSSYIEDTYTSLENCANNNDGDIVGCQHVHLGNYYNWSAAVASNNTTKASNSQQNSICPKNWELPTGSKYDVMLRNQGIRNGPGNAYTENGFDKFRVFPLYFARYGIVKDGLFMVLGSYGYYWFNSVVNSSNARILYFDDNLAWIDYGYTRYSGLSLRCISK